MTEFDHEPGKADIPSATRHQALEHHVSQLEDTLLEYVERYGLTDKAREALRVPKGLF